jgi:hypothetical protein
VYRCRFGRIPGKLHRRNQPAFKPQASVQPAIRKSAESTCHIFLLPPLARSLSLPHLCRPFIFSRPLPSSPSPPCAARAPPPPSPSAAARRLHRNRAATVCCPRATAPPPPCVGPRAQPRPRAACTATAPPPPAPACNHRPAPPPCRRPRALHHTRASTLRTPSVRCFARTFSLAVARSAASLSFAVDRMGREKRKGKEIVVEEPARKRTRAAREAERAEMVAKAAEEQASGRARPFTIRGPSARGRGRGRGMGRVRGARATRATTAAAAAESDQSPSVAETDSDTEAEQSE